MSRCLWKVVPLHAIVFEGLLPLVSLRGNGEFNPPGVSLAPFWIWHRKNLRWTCFMLYSWLVRILDILAISLLPDTLQWKTSLNKLAHTGFIEIASIQKLHKKQSVSILPIYGKIELMAIQHEIGKYSKAV